MVSLVDPAILQSVADEIANQRQRSTAEAIKLSYLPLLPSASPSSSSTSSSAAATSVGGTAGQEFEYSKYAIFSGNVSERDQGVRYLQALYDSGYKSSETAYWLTIGYMETGQYPNARHILTHLVRSDPSNEKAAALLEIYKEQVKQKGWRGIGYVVGGIALGIIGTGLLIYWYRSSSPLWSTNEWMKNNVPYNSNNNNSNRINNSNSPLTTWRGSSGSNNSSSGSSNGSGYRRY